MLLRQALADLPFQKGYGKVMDAWGSLVKLLMSSSQFQRADLSAKTAQNRFNALIDQGRKHNASAAAKSGDDEEETELQLLLDELIQISFRHIMQTLGITQTIEYYAYSFFLCAFVALRRMNPIW